jgi:hypothetical protein
MTRLFAIITLLVCACDSSPKNAEPRAKSTRAAVTPAQREADHIWSNRCTPCHGPLGEGNGPASGALNPKPRNLSSSAWHQTITDEHIEKAIQYGGAAIGKSPAMPANPDLTGKPEVVAALRAKVRSFAR